MKFVPLHITSGYSFLQSGLTIPKIAKAVKENNYFAMGLTDKGAMYGIPEFVTYAEKINKPYIVGLDITIDGDSISLFVINEEGYHNLVMINSLIQKHEITLKDLGPYKEGLVAIIETAHGKFKENFENQKESDFAKDLAKYSEIFKDDFMLGIEVTSKEGVAYANKIRQFANKYPYECIAFPRIKYLKKDDAIVLEIVTAIANDEKIEAKSKTGQEYFMKEEDYNKIYTPKELANTINLVNRSTFKYHIKRGELLHYPCENSIKHLTDLCEEALRNLHIEDEAHKERLKHELDIIISMGYPDYFLVVADYVNWSKEHDILVGPGRGSAAGSLVAYLLGITEVDPLTYNLQFERFLNPYRKTMPDIDVDFQDTKRDLAVQYLRDKYGSNKVANISTFQTILAKQALRDIGRVYDFSNNIIDLLCKKLTEKDYDLRESYKKIPEFKKLVDNDKYILDIVTLASKIEGLPRQPGMHAAGIVLNNFPLDGAIPVTIDFENNYISQYEMGYLEEQGFLKMDFLGLRNLTTIALCVDLINQKHPELHLKADQIPFDTPEIYEMICQGMNIGIFQIETAAMAESIKILQPNCFNDVVALLALGRPGPMTYIPNYARRKEGKEKINYACPEIEDILKETYGIIVYQEQINQIAMVMAGFSAGEADLFRRAVSKKDKDKLIQLKESFIKGSLAKGHSQKISEIVFANILRFCDYGFNKSHSVVYSIIATRMMYLKIHYPLEFYAAVLETSSTTSDTKFNEYMSEMNKRGYKILPPSVNESKDHFVIKDNGLLFPLTSISGINNVLYQKIDEERTKNGSFADFFDFIARMYGYKINETQIQKLIEGGALDCLYPSRASMLINIKAALQYAELNYNEDGSLLLDVNFMPKPNMFETKDNPIENLDKEYEVLGVMLSDNPLRFKQELLAQKGVTKLADVDINDNKDLTICGIIKNKKNIRTKKGVTMSFVKIFDDTGELEITVFPTLYEQVHSLLEKNNIILVQGHMSNKNDRISFAADSISPLEE